MDGKTLKGRLTQGQATYGTWLGLEAPAVAEVLARIGFDWIIIDTEHAPLNASQVERILMAFSGSETLPIVRVAWNDLVLIKLMLDVGAGGIMVPMVNSAQEAVRAVAACKYPPQGIRGVGPRRASGYGRRFQEYLERANEETLVIAQIESLSAVENLEEIISVEGLDAILVGPADLTASLGLLPRLDHPQVQATIERVLDICKRHRFPFGLAAADAQAARHWAAMGGQLMALGEDLGFMATAAAEALKVARGEA